MTFTRYLGKRELFQRIFYKVSRPTFEQELCSWFVYRVYRSLTNASDNVPIKGPDDPVVQEIASELMTDDKVVKSMRRYQGEDLIFFGQWTAPDRVVYNGGSKDTIAFQRASELLRAKLHV